MAAAVAFGALVTALWAREHYQRQQRQTVSAMLTRQAEGLARAAQTFGPADTLVVGDSILTLAPITCGRTFHMTVPSVRAGEIIPSALVAARHLRPKVMVVGLGTNDQRDLGRPARLDALAGSPARIIWVTTGVSPGTNAAMTRLAGQRSETVYRPPLSDGVHPDVADRARISRELSELCRRESHEAD